jgi:hypothetical protein
MDNRRFWQANNVVRKWVKDKRNATVVERVNNQAPIPRPAHEQKHVFP